MLPVTSASYYRLLHWFIQVVDNCNVKTKLICNETLFQQTNMVKTDSVYVRTGELTTLGIFVHQANQTLNQLVMLVNLY